jgi:Fe-Mn family superoxide dismutase
MKIIFSESYSKKFVLDPLPYSTDYLEPIIDTKTMEIHHGKHHQGYIDKLNEVLEKNSNIKFRDIEDLLKNINSLPKDIQASVRNNGGGHFNHNLFWNILISVKDYEKPSPKMNSIIEKNFGSFEKFKKVFSEAAKNRFGSGWTWLILRDNRLEILSTPNQDTPLNEGKPILGLDVWEHAYYLNYQNKRADYIENFFKIINWKKVEENLYK